MYSRQALAFYFDEWRNIVNPASELNIESYRTFFKTTSLSQLLEDIKILAFIFDARDIINLTANEEVFLEAWTTAIKQNYPGFIDAAMTALDTVSLMLQFLMEGKRLFISLSGLMGMAPA